MEFNMEIMDETVAMDAIDDLMTGIAFGIAVGSLFFC